MHRKALWERQGKKYSTHPKPSRNSGFTPQISEDRASYKLLRTPEVLPQVPPHLLPILLKDRCDILAADFAEGSDAKNHPHYWRFERHWPRDGAAFSAAGLEHCRDDAFARKSE
jgi:hypothetical protein